MQNIPKHKRKWISKNIIYEYEKKTYGSYFGKHEDIIKQILQNRKKLQRECGIVPKPVHRLENLEIRIMDLVFPLNDSFLETGTSEEKKLVFNYNAFFHHKKIVNTTFNSDKQKWVLLLNDQALHAGRID